MRVVLPLRNTLLELITKVRPVNGDGSVTFPRKTLLQFATTFYEDNATALNLAVKQHITSRTKHWCIKSHFFWDHVNDKSKRIAVVKVDTAQQRANYLTKGLTWELFENCRVLNQGW